MTPIGTIIRSQSDVTRAYVQLDDEWVPSFQGLDRFSHIIVLYQAPNERPNGIGLSVVELLRVEDELLTVNWLNAPDATPVFDIKPYLSQHHSVVGAVKG